MLNSITSFFFGSGAVDEQTEATGTTTTTGSDPAATSSTGAPTCRLKESRTDEDWVLVDRSRGNSPHRMESNPLENLLIEHPSMSVYGPRLRQGSTGMDSDISESSTEGDVVLRPVDRPSTSGTSRRPVAVRSSPRRPRAVAARAGLPTNMHTVKLSQAAEKRSNKRRLSAGQLARSNTARHVESRGKRQRHTSFLLQPSARSANKRC